MEKDPVPHTTCDGGNLDCGSGLLLIIKKHMDPLNNNEILEVKSRESTVAEDLPAWCRMVQHEFLGARKNEHDTSYFIRKGRAERKGVDGSTEVTASDDAEDHIEDAISQTSNDFERAHDYQWAVRVQSQKGNQAKVFTRNHSFNVGQPADFSEKVEAPSAVDYLLASLGSCITVGFHMHASRQNLIVDVVEVQLKGKLDNVLYHLQIEEEGSSQLQQISGTFFVSSPEDDKILQSIWEQTLERSPIYQTLKNQVHVDLNLSVVM